MDSTHTDNVLANIEKQFQSIADDGHDDGFILDDCEYQVIDSFEIGDVDDIHASDASYSQLLRKRRKPSYARRRENEFPRNDYHRSHRTNYRRSPKRSISKVSDHHPLKSRERRTIESNSVDEIRISVKNSPRKVDKLPDLKCTTSLETGEVSVVLLSEDTSKPSYEDDKEKETSDPGRKRPPTLVKNPFAYTSLKRKVSSSPEKGKLRRIEMSPRINMERCSSERNCTERNSLERPSIGRHSIEKHRRGSVDSRSHDSQNRDRSLSPVRSRTSRRSSPYYGYGRARRRSSSRHSERYRSRRRSRDYRRSRESSRKNSRSRDSSNLSRVSSRSSLSFMSIRGDSPNEHDRKSSPLRPNNCYVEPRQNNENYFSTKDDFNYKLNLLLSERKHKQLSIGNESGSSISSTFNNSTWKYENWTNPGSGMYPQPQDAGVNYSDGVVGKPFEQQQAAHPGYSQDQYNQPCYNNLSQSYPSMYPGSIENSGQFSYNYGNLYPNQIPSQYYPPSSTAINFPSTSYTDQTSAQYPPMAPSEESVILNCIPQNTSNVPQQQYPLQEESNCVPNNPLPTVDTQPSAFAEASQNEHYGSSNSVPNIDLDTAPSEPPQKVEESDEEEAPPPPVISNTWREIETVEESSWQGADKKWNVLGKCEGLLKKLMSSDPSMERFKFPEMMQFSVQEEVRNAPNLNSKNSVRAARRLAKTLRYQSPLLRKRNNPPLKFEPWMPVG